MTQINFQVGADAVGFAYSSLDQLDALLRGRATSQPDAETLQSVLTRSLTQLNSFLDSFPEDGADRSILTAQAGTIALAKTAFRTMQQAEATPGITRLDAAAAAAGDAAMESLWASDTVPINTSEGAYQFLALAAAVMGLHGRIALRVESGALDAPLRDGFARLLDRTREAIDPLQQDLADQVTVTPLGLSNEKESGADGSLPRTERWVVFESFNLNHPSAEFGARVGHEETYMITYAADGTVESGFEAARARVEARVDDTLDARIDAYVRTLPELAFWSDAAEARLERFTQFEQVVAQDVGVTLTATGPEANFLVGSVGDDVLIGSDIPAALHGGAGRDDLTGGSSNDTLDGGAGADILRGGAGHDTYIVGSPEDVVIETSGEGQDTVRTSVDFALGEASILFLRGLGSEGLALTGSVRREQIFGTPGEDTIDGGGGRDDLTGNGGADTFRFDEMQIQTVIADFASGEDRITIDGTLIGVTVEGDGPMALTGTGVRDLFARGIASYDAEQGQIFLDYAGDDEGLVRAISVGGDTDLSYTDIWLT